MHNFVFYIVLFFANSLVAQTWFQGGVGSGYDFNDTLYCSIDANNLFSRSTLQGNGFNSNTASYCTLGGNVMFQSTDSVSGFDFSMVSLCVSNNQNVLFTSSIINSGGNFSEASLCSTVANQTPFRGLDGSGYKSILGTCLIPLPIELLVFEAVPDGDKVWLYWSTASETNNSYFIVERTTDLQYWNDIIEVEGAGFSTELLEYEVVDDFPEEGISYYRLRQVDFDGEFSYSQIRKVEFKANQSVGLFAYPNPAKDIITIVGDINVFSVYNIMGQRIAGKISVISQDNKVTKLNVSNLSSGVYVLKTNSGDFCKFNVE